MGLLCLLGVFEGKSKPPVLLLLKMLLNVLSNNFSQAGDMFLLALKEELSTVANVQNSSPAEYLHPFYQISKYANIGNFSTGISPFPSWIANFLFDQVISNSVL